MLVEFVFATLTLCSLFLLWEAVRFSREAVYWREQYTDLLEKDVMTELRHDPADWWMYGEECPY